jgi:hypothetical protein
MDKEITGMFRHPCQQCQPVPSGVKCLSLHPPVSPPELIVLFPFHQLKAGGSLVCKGSRVIGEIQEIKGFWRQGVQLAPANPAGPGFRCYILNSEQNTKRRYHAESEYRERNQSSREKGEGISLEKRKFRLRYKYSFLLLLGPPAVVRTGTLRPFWRLILQFFCENAAIVPYN